MANKKNKLKAIKILQQYKRLAEKLGSKLTDKRIQELDRLRDNGSIKISDLPAKLGAEFPREFGDMTLNEIQAYEE